MREWIQTASQLDEIAESEDSPSKKSSLQKIFGLNLSLTAREARGVPLNHWVELKSSRAKIGEMPLSLILECLLKEARTYFSKNGGTLPSHTGSQSLIARMTRQKS